VNRNRGSLLVTLVPSLLFAAAAAAGWYFYYAELEASKTVASDTQSEQQKLIYELKQFQYEIGQLKEKNRVLISDKNSASDSQSKHKIELDKLRQQIASFTEKESALNRDLAAEKSRYTELKASLSTLKAEKGQIESSMQQQVEKVAMTTTELEKQLKERQEQQKSLNVKMGSVSGEKQILASQLKNEQDKRQLLEQKIAAVSADIDKKTTALNSAESEVSQLNSRLKKTTEHQKSLEGQVLELNRQRQKDSEQFSQLKSLLERELNDSQVAISELKNKMVVIRLTSGILFGTGSADITVPGRKILALIAESLNAYPDRNISIEGHTDLVPIGEDSAFESNWDLSASRALAAVHYFQHSKNVDPTRLQLVGLGEFHPVSNNDTESGRKLNRRIEIRILPPESALAVQDLDTIQN